MTMNSSLNLTIYTPEGAQTATVLDGDHGLGNDQAARLLGPDDEAAVFVYADGRVFYLSRWGLGHRRIVDLFGDIDARLHRRFELLIEQHHLDIATVQGAAGTWDAALTAGMVLAAGEAFRYAAG